MCIRDRIREMRKNMSDKLPLARGAAQADSRYNDAAHRLVKRQAVDASRLDGYVRWDVLAAVAERPRLGGLVPVLRFSEILDHKAAAAEAAYYLLPAVHELKRVFFPMLKLAL